MSRFAILRGSGEQISLGKVTSVAFSPDEPLYSQRLEDKTLRLWDVKSGVEIRIMRGRECVRHLRSIFSDGDRLVSGSSDKTLHLGMRKSRGVNSLSCRGHANHVDSVAFSPNGQRLLSGSLDKTLRLWDAASGQQLTVLRGLDGPRLRGGNPKRGVCTEQEARTQRSV